MANPDPQARFIARYSSLQNLITEVSNWEEVKSHASLKKLVPEMLTFSNNYSDYFQKLPDIRFSELNTALTRLQEEWSRISRACEQRRLSTFKDILIATDYEAANIYKRFVGYKWDNSIGPITYIEKSFEITRYAFTPYPLISVPFLFIDETENIRQSLAHEIGHFIYWNYAPINPYQDIQKELREEVTKQLSEFVEVPTSKFDLFRGWQKLNQRWGGWIEETFADVAGTLFGFKGFFDSACDIANEMSFAELIYDDGEHPVYFLRPFIALETLNWMSHQPLHREFVPSPSDIDDLKTQWLKKLAKNGIDQNHTTFELPFELIQKSVAIVVNTIIEKPLWANSLPTDDDNQRLAKLGELIFPTAPLNESMSVRIPPINTLDSFAHLRQQLEHQIIGESQKNNIALDSQGKQLFFLLRGALIDLDLGDEAGKLFGPPLPPPWPPPPWPPRHH